MAKQKTTFKRLVTNLPYNPSLISQVVFYSKRLKHETSIRRMGFVFIALTFLIQMFAVIAPPTATSAQDQNNDLLAGGFSSRAEAVGACTDSRKDFGTILANYGISCANVAATSVQTIRSTDYNGQLYSMGRLPYGKPGEYRVVINGRTYYMRPLRSWDSGAFSSYKALVGTSKTGARFMLLFDCGNLTVVGRPSPPPPAPVKTANCSVLLSNYAAGSVLKKGSLISLRGQVTGAYLPAGQTVRMNYDYIDLDTGKIVVGQSIHPNIAFKNGLANDPNAANYTLNTPGRYQFRLSAVMDSKDVPGSLQGRCLVNVSVEMPPIDVCPQLPGLQTDIIQCRPCKDATNNDAIACLVLSKTVSNDTTNVINADGTEAKAGDVLTYTLSTKNTGKVTVKKYVVKENISDVQDYADVLGNSVRNRIEGSHKFCPVSSSIPRTTGWRK